MKITRKQENKIKEFGEVVNWMHRIELNLESLEKRLDAVERRLSNEPFEGVRFEEEIADSKNFERKFNEIKKEIESLKEKIVHSKSKDEKIPLISLRKKEGERKSVDYGKKIREIEERLEKFEGKTIVKIRGIEFPVEITGVIGGILAFVIGIFLIFGRKEVILSPSFVFSVGTILLISTGIKIYLFNRKNVS